MTPRSSQPDPLTPRPLSNWSIAAGALVVLTVAAVVGFALLRRYGGQGAQIQLDAIRTAETLVIGIGGAVALLLTARRQRYTELALVYTDRDATERRITELYTKAADQLGSEKAPVRLAGLHALERLAQNTTEQRQTIVDVICAYLRMPYTPPDEQSPAEDALAEAHTSYENRRQEQQVRLTAQNILSRNLSINQHNVDHRSWWHRTPPPAVPNWPGIRLDLSGALLLKKFSLARCQLDYANFKHAKFTDGADFTSAQFTDEADFTSAQFTGRAFFPGARFTDLADFTSAQFTGGADFSSAQFTDLASPTSFAGAQFTGGALFVGSQFTGSAFFASAQFTKGAAFVDAKFTSGANFVDAKFTSGAGFVGTQFTGGTFFVRAQFTGGADFVDALFTVGASFVDAQFTGGADFEGARLSTTAEPDTVWPPGWTTRPAQPENGEDPAFLYLAKVEDDNPSHT